MENKKISQSKVNLEKAMEKLAQAVNKKSPSELDMDGTIQRFEFTIELFWKLLKRMLEANGIQPISPKDTLKKAFQNYWLADEDIWLAMLNDRNIASHNYDEDMARQIYLNIKKYYPLMNSTFQKLKDMD